MRAKSCPDHTKQNLLIHGTILFLLGLFNGAIVSAFTNPRMGLSAHLAGVQNGIVLWAFGLFWLRLKLSRRSEIMTYWTAPYGMYGIWLGLLLAAAWGANNSTPIAGAGYHATPLQEGTVSFFILTGSLAIIIATVFVLAGLIQQKNHQPL